MVNVKSALALGLLASTASAAAAHGKHDRRHVHHRRGKACTTASAPYPVNGNGTAPAGTGAMSSTQSVITYTVVPVPISPTTSAPAAGSTGPAGESTVTVPVVVTITDCPESVTNCPARTHTTYSTSVITTPNGDSAPTTSPAGGAPSAPAGTECGVATSYVTVQQTVTVTAGQVPETTSSSVAVVSTPAVITPSSSSSAAPVAVQSSSSSSSVPPPPPPPALTSAVATTTTAAPVVAPSSSSTPAPSSTPASTPVSTSIGSKLGAALIPWTNPISNFGSTVKWFYDWQQKPSTTVPSGVQYVPTLHGSEQCASFGATLAGQSGIGPVKHFNEPDMGGQADLSPSAAAGLHNQYIAPLMSKYQFALPAVTSNNASYVDALGFASGSMWLKEFIPAVGGCSGFAFADAHWYGWDASAEDQAQVFLKYVDDFKNDIDSYCPGQNLQIWFSEVGAIPLDDSSVNAAFWQIVSKSLDTNSAVARYSPFQNTNGELSQIIGGIDTFLHSIGL